MGVPQKNAIDGLFHGKSERDMDENWGYPVPLYFRTLPSGITMDNPTHWTHLDLGSLATCHGMILQADGHLIFPGIIWDLATWESTEFYLQHVNPNESKCWFNDQVLWKALLIKQKTKTILGLVNNVETNLQCWY